MAKCGNPKCIAARNDVSEMKSTLESVQHITQEILLIDDLLLIKIRLKDIDDISGECLANLN